MSAAILTPLIGPILELVERLVPDPKERARLEGELTRAAAEAEARIAEAQSAVVVAEASGSPMQRNWRPILMFVLMGLLVWHGVALPILAAIIGVPISATVGLTHVPEGLWTLLTVGMGGYIAGRSAEKVFGRRD